MCDYINIQHITENALCTACGSCAGVCPKNAVEMAYNSSGYMSASINPDLCLRCKKCLNVCPSNGQLLPAMDVKAFGGNIISAFIGFSSNATIRQESQSGGVVTALLCYLLSKKKIDGAVVNQFDPLSCRPNPVYVESEEEIIKGCGSYYAQTPVVETIIKNKNKKMAAVVLGCQAESLILARKKHPEISIPEYTIGLICAGQNSSYMIDDLITHSSCNPEKENICKFRFRYKGACGWPGNVFIQSDKGSHTLSKEKRLLLKPVYECHRCIICFDKMNIYSDIVCGDPWGIDVGNADKLSKGYTVIITRTEKGRMIINDAIRDNIISAERISEQTILTGQSVINEKLKLLNVTKDIFKRRQWMYPYILSSEIVNTRISSKYLKVVEKRLSYTRKLYLSEDANEAMKIIKNKKRVIKTLNHIKYPARIIKKWACFKK